MIIFIRHGETDYNAKEMLQGKINIPLNSNGIEEAKKAALELKNFKIDRIFASPLDRAKETAKIINEYHNLEITLDDRIKEIGFGTFEGMNKYHLPEEFYTLRKTNPEKYNAESQDSILNRVIGFYNSIKDLNGNTLIVSHGGIYKVLAKHLGIYDEGYIPNCSIITLQK